MALDDYFWWINNKNLGPLTVEAFEAQGGSPYKYSFIVTDSKGVQVMEHMNLSVEKLEDRAYAIVKGLKEKGYALLSVNVLGLHESELEAKVKQRQEEERQKREKAKPKQSEPSP